MSNITNKTSKDFLESFLMDKRPLQPKDWALDTAIAVAAYVFGCVQLVLAASSLLMPDESLRRLLGIQAIVPSASAFVALALTVLPLVVRRRFPWPVFVFTCVAFLSLQGAFRGYSLTIVGPLVALYTLASERSRAEAITATAIALVGLIFAVGSTQSTTMAFLTRFQNMALMIAAALAGYAFRTHREYLRATEQRAAEAERTREEVAARRVEEERVLIAREVHDITAHSLSAVSIQAAAAERMIDRDPQAAKEAISTARRTAKDALEEIRGMIGVLRQGEGSAEKEPTKGTDRLVDLAVYLEKAGVQTQVDDTSYDRSCVPAYVDVALYGIAREAATNIARHANAKAATIRLWVADGTAHLVVEDDGQGSAVLNESRGHGIQGMTERARLLGGSLEASPRVNGGFRVTATLPCSGLEEAEK